MILIEAFAVMKDCRSIIYSPHGACNHDSESLLRGHLFLLLNTLAGRHDAESCLQVHVREKLEKIGLCTPNGDRSLAWSTNKTDGHWWCAIIIISVEFALFSHRIIGSLTIQLSICFLMANFCWSPGSNSERFRNRRAFVFVSTKPPQSRCRTACTNWPAGRVESTFDKRVCPKPVSLTMSRLIGA